MLIKTEERLQLVATNPGNNPTRISVVRLHRSPLHFLTDILSLQIATLYKLCCNEKSCSILKSLFLEEFAVLHLNMAGFLEVVQPFQSPGSNFCCKYLKSLQSHALPAARARELLKPSVDSASLVPEIEKKNFFGLGLGFSIVYVTMEGCFGLCFLALGSGQMGHFLSQIFLHS